MSGLAAVLAGRSEPGVYRWHAAFAVPDVRHAVEHAEWRFAHLDGVGIEERAAALAAVKEALGLPAYVGSNLDALWDGLREVDEPMVLLWDSWAPLARADRAGFDGLLGVLGGRAEQGGLTVLLRGEGPEIDVPFLD